MNETKSKTSEFWKHRITTTDKRIQSNTITTFKAIKIKMMDFAVVFLTATKIIDFGSALCKIIPSITLI